MSRKNWTPGKVARVVAAGSGEEVDALLHDTGEAVETKWRSRQTGQDAAPEVNPRDRTR